MSDPETKAASRTGRHPRTVLIYATLLFVVGAVAVALSLRETGFLSGDYGWGTALFFVVYGVFTITMGFPHPGFGHVSFDRVAQVASILVLAFAEQICGQLRRAVETADWSDIGDGGVRLRITISFGIAQADAGSRPATLLSSADTRLYRAKNRGRNRVVA